MDTPEEREPAAGSATHEALNLHRQTSEELHDMLSKALSSIEQKPSPRPSPTPSGLPPVATMLGVLAKLQSSAQLVSSAIRNLDAHVKLSTWRSNARQAAIPSLFYDLALQTFEGADHLVEGTLGADDANNAFQVLVEKLELEFGEQYHELATACLFSERVGFVSFLKVISGLELPDMIKTAVHTAVHGVSCVCGAWLIEKPRHACYPGGAVRCDFTGKSVQADTVWHCERNRAAVVHPFGFDLAGECVEEFRHFQQTARLHDRLGSAILAVADDAVRERDLREHRAACAKELLPSTSNMYLSIKDDVTNAKAAGHANAELEKRLVWCKTVLQTEDWAARKQEARARVESTLQGLQDFAQSLSHDKLQFKDAEHRDSETAGFEAEFEPATRHAAFEKSTEEFRRVSTFCKDFVGFEQFDASEPETEQLMTAFGEQILQALMTQRGLMFVPIESSFTQKDEGVEFRWKLAVAPAGQQIELVHKISLDRSDVEHAQMHRRFMGAYHDVQERIRGLAGCATEADLLTQLTEFNVATEDACCGEVCVICQEDMQYDEPALKINSCGHCFHGDCVRSWLLGCKQECPICKAPVKAEAVLEERFAPGTHIVLGGLQARSELNGVQGEVAGFVESSRRYRVQTTNGVLSVLPRNVSVVVKDSRVDEDEEELRDALAMSMHFGEDPQSGQL
eukprot:TRINITY_DN898_c0_g1_i1.p1 TRINITY_DN898_c0_g1~~TRINITY_DN898_c0_g1_i1.p1  ORF type:complete len:683 (-),score=156.14 TRINITY_DN898_c0_g1_i1:106-2154(-)